MAHVLFIGSSMDRLLGCFHRSAGMENAAVRTHPRASRYVGVFFTSLGYIPGSGFAGSNGNCVSPRGTARRLQGRFTRVPMSLYSHRRCLCSDILTLAISVGETGYHCRFGLHFPDN